MKTTIKEAKESGEVCCSRFVSTAKKLLVSTVEIMVIVENGQL